MTKQWMMFALAGAGLALVPRPAAAEEDLTELKLVIVRADLAVGAAMENGDRAEQAVNTDPALCFAAVDKLTAAGTPPTEVLHGRTEFLFKRAKERCEEFAQWKQLVAGAVVMATAQQRLVTLAGMEPGSVGSKFIEHALADGKECTAGVDRALKAGAPADVAVKAGWLASGERLELTLADGKTRLCEAFAAWTKGFKVKNDQAKADAAKAVRDKYVKAGIGGDRLELFIEYDDVRWRGKGCEIVDDLGALKQAAVLFHWLENADGTHTIRRYAFKGDKLLKTTNRTFKTEAAAYRGCK